MYFILFCVKGPSGPGEEVRGENAHLPNTYEGK